VDDKSVGKLSKEATAAATKLDASSCVLSRPEVLLSDLDTIELSDLIGVSRFDGDLHPVDEDTGDDSFESGRF
jgi:hypothetical protein